MKTAKLAITIEYSNNANDDVIRLALQSVVSSVTGSVLDRGGELPLLAWYCDLSVSEPKDDSDNTKRVIRHRRK